MSSRLFFAAVIVVAAGCGGARAVAESPDASVGCPAGQHSSNGQCVPDTAPGVPTSETFASLCAAHLSDSFMSAFVLEWSRVGIAGCENLGAFLATQRDLAFTFAEAPRTDDGRLQFRPWLINDTVVEALAAVPNVESLVFENLPAIHSLAPLAQLPTLRSLTVVGTDAHDFSFVKDLALTELRVRSNGIDSLVPLADETQLRLLSLTNTRTADLAPLAGLTQLTLLTLADNEITDLTPLAGLTSLTEMTLRNNAIVSIAPLRNLTALRLLVLTNNAITDLAPLVGLVKLTGLAIDQNAIASFAPLASLVELTQLNLNRTGFSDLGALAANTKLTALTMSENPITDLTPLRQRAATLRTLAVQRLLIGSAPFDTATISTLTELRSLAIGNNRLTDLTLVDPLTNLEALVASSNAITDVTPVGKLTNLTRLELNANTITNLDPLGPLTKLTTVVMTGNPIDRLHCPVAPTAQSAALSTFCASIR